MIQRVSELDLYNRDDFRNDYCAQSARASFKASSYYNYLSESMLFEVSLGRPLSSNGAIDDRQNEAVSYYKSYKMGADVLGLLAMICLRYQKEVTFGLSGGPERCTWFWRPYDPVADGVRPSDDKNARDDHYRYPDEDVSRVVVFYCKANFHSELHMHNFVAHHDKTRLEGGFTTGRRSRIDMPGCHNVPFDHWEEQDWEPPLDPAYVDEHGVPLESRPGMGTRSWYFLEPIHGCAMSAMWADLAECYHSDKEYEPGTLLKFGGEEEVTIADDEANAVVTTKPGLILNSPEGKSDKIRLGIALTGRTPVRVIGRVKKFDRLCLSNTPGLACSKSNPGFEDRPTIARALEANDSDGEASLMCTVQLAL